MNAPARSRSLSRSPSLSTPAVPAVPTWGWLALGVVATALVGMRFNVALLGWVAAVPWLVYLRRTSGWRSRVVFAGALQLGMFLAVLKIVTDPIPFTFAPMFSVPMALSASVAYLGFEALRRRLGDAWGLALFPAITIALEWLGAFTSPMGSWGALAYSQVDNLALLQVTSLFGLSGVSVLLAATSAVVAVLVDAPSRRWLRVGLGVAAVVLAAHAWGSFRMFAPLDGPMITVATVVSEAKLSPAGLPPEDELQRATDGLFERSAEAAARGAQVVVWNEAATVVDADDEPALVERGRALAASAGVDLILAYAVPIDGLSLFENKYVWMTPEGPIETYFKHHPVPSEGSIAGVDPLVAHDRPYGTAAGAICYDYDFPAMGKAHAALDADLVVLPSSDWLGIDPYHTQMASIRGIEGGYSVVRSVRAATSGAYDARGVARGLARDYEGQYLMLAQVPARRVHTLYSRIGDVLPLLAGFVILGGLALALVRGRRARQA